jgi:hypothetical protein
MIDAISGDKRESVVLPTYSRSQHTAAKPPRTSAASTSAPKSGASLWDNLTEAAKAH